MTRCLHAIRHVAFEDLGSLDGLARARGFVPQYTEAVDLPRDGFPWDTVDPVVVLGGPIGVNDAADYPCINEALAGLRRRLAHGLPTLGICLGAQLIAAAMGAQVRPTGRQHVGWWPLEAIAADGPLAALQALPVLHWHGDTFEIPHGARRLAATAAVTNQAFSMAEDAILALQFHLEITPRAIEHWLVGHRSQLGQLDIAPAALRAQTAQHGVALERAAHQVFGPWLDAAR
ncbi:glutamine amidotransferase [Algiphilus sp.]|uniref:glutamine amidotransferase n=1 Tax=Algiphilus sp. TaxID=1872431 RepID=UPI002A63CBAC|nr:glutamine amidotransferase [Pseudomonadota bacterium]